MGNEYFRHLLLKYQIQFRVQYLHIMLCAGSLQVNVKPEDPLFSLPKGKYITYSHFQIRLHELISKLHLNPDLYSSHSFRRGGSTSAFQAGVPAELIQFQEDWRSDAYKKYLTFSLNDKVSVAMKMKQHILGTESLT